MIKIFTLGRGFVSEHLPYHVINQRIASAADVDEVINELKPDVLINCIGRTGRPNVDWCESNKEATAFANTAVPIMVADACAKRGVHLIQIGSGCIYFGPSPNAHKFFDCEDEEYIDIEPGWKEEDFANPKSFYSKSKYSCDLMLGGMSHVTTLRIRMPISTKNNERNLINKLRGYNQVIDIPNSVTFMDDLARCIDWAAKTTPSGIYHVVNPQPLTAARVMREYQKYNPQHSFNVINEEQLDKLTVAKRSNCILNSDKLKQAGFTMTPTLDALKSCMAEYVKNL